MRKDYKNEIYVTVVFKILEMLLGLQLSNGVMKIKKNIQ